MKKIILLLGVVLLFPGYGCASYNPRVGIPDAKTFQETGIRTVDSESGIEIVAYPIQTKEDTNLYFDSTSLADDELLPVYVSIFASDIDITKKYLIDSIFIKIKDRSISAIPADEAYKLIKKSWFGRSTFWWFFGLYVGAPISAGHTYYINNKIEKDLIGKEFKGESGFLYFRIPDNLESLDNSFLVFIFDKDLTVKLPLKGVITAKSWW